MNITMDRYEADWSMVERGWNTHVRGEGPRLRLRAARPSRPSAREQPGVLDQDLPPFVIARDGKPVGPIVDGDSVILFNFRGDRAIEITRAFEEEDVRASSTAAPRPDVLVRRHDAVRRRRRASRRTSS